VAASKLCSASCGSVCCCYATSERWARFAHLKAVRQVPVEDRPEAQFEHEKGMLQQKAAQLGTGGQAFLEFEQEGFHIGALRMRALAWPARIHHWLGNHAPIEEGKEGAIALHDGVMFQEFAEGRLVKGR